MADVNDIYGELCELRKTAMARGFQTAAEQARGRRLVDEYYDASSGTVADWDKTVTVPVRDEEDAVGQDPEYYLPLLDEEDAPSLKADDYCGRYAIAYRRDRFNG